MSISKKDNNKAQAALKDFKERVASLMENESYSSIAEKSNLSKSNIQAMLEGKTPGIDKVAALALGLGVRLDWLVLGRGPVYEAPNSPDVRSFFKDELARKAFVDLETIKTIIEHFEAIRDPAKDYSPAQVANTIALMSVLFTGNLEDHDPESLMQMVKEL